MQTDPHLTFRALADPTRRDILQMLSKADHTIAEVAAHFDMTRPAVKKHLGVLEQGNLIRVVASGRERINQLHPAGMQPVLGWLATFDAFWDDRLAALKTAVEAKEAYDEQPNTDDHTSD